LELFVGWKKALEDVQVYLGMLESKLTEKVQLFEAIKKSFCVEDEVFHFDTSSKRTKNSILLAPRYLDSRDLFKIQFEIKCTPETLELMQHVSQLLYSHYELKDYSKALTASLGSAGVGEFGF
jgi:hypothetical protein